MYFKIYVSISISKCWIFSWLISLKMVDNTWSWEHGVELQSDYSTSLSGSINNIITIWMHIFTRLKFEKFSSPIYATEKKFNEVS